MVSLDWPELPHRNGVWKYKWLGAIPKVRCGICAVSTLRMCFYACRISLISGLSNEDLICWGDSWNCRGYSVIGICFRISLVDANSFVLVSWYFDIWNLFSLEFVFAGATFECSFCRVIGFERIAPTAYDAVGDVMIWIAIRWEKCLLGFPPKPLCVFLGFVFVFSPPDDEKISRESRGLELGSRAERPMRKLISDGGEITKTRFGYFSRLLVCFGCFGF